jgi:hypothetical protein
MLLSLVASGETIIRGSGRAEYLSDVWGMYQKTYSAIGMHLSSPHELLNYDEWHLVFSNEGKPIAFTMFETTAYGLKLGLLGGDGSPDGRQQVVHALRSKFLKPGIYGEVSHKVQDIALSAGAPVVCPVYVSEIIHKSITPGKTPISYVRMLRGVGAVEKVMVGNPRGIPTTDAQNPVCPAIQPEASAAHMATEDRMSDMTMHQACLMEFSDDEVRGSIR